MKSFISSKSHEVKSTATHCILATNMNIEISWRKNDEEERIPDLRLGNVFQLPSRRISRIEGGLEVKQTEEALCAQTNLIWREMKTKCILKPNNDKKIFALSRNATH